MLARLRQAIASSARRLGKANDLDTASRLRELRGLAAGRGAVWTPVHGAQDGAERRGLNRRRLVIARAPRGRIAVTAMRRRVARIEPFRARLAMESPLGAVAPGGARKILDPWRD